MTRTVTLDLLICDYCGCYIIDGEVEFKAGHMHTHAGPGTTVYLPHGVLHAWRPTEQIRLLRFNSQPGFDQSFIGWGSQPNGWSSRRNRTNHRTSTR